MTSEDDLNVLIVGAGPSGLLLSLLLSSCTPPIPSTILEKSAEIDRNPRASFYVSPVLHEFRRVPGLMQRVLAEAFIPDAVAWRHLDGREIVSASSGNEKGKETMISLPLDGLLPIMVNLLGEMRDDEKGLGRLLLQHEVVKVGQPEEGGKKAWVDVKVPGEEGTQRFEASYVVGCDGANSTVRKALFGDSWPGFTWDKQIVATNVYYPRFESFNWTTSSFMLHPTHFSMVAQIANDGLLRITYGEEGNLSYDELKKRLPWKFKIFVPGAPEESEYKIENFSPFKIHQRCAESFRVGRILLAADAAHVCNPFGGMGLTGGLVDIGNLFDCLYGLATGRASETDPIHILDRYSAVRAAKFHQIIDPISSGNLRRLWDDSDEGIAAEPLFKALERAKVDPEFAATMKGGMDAVMHDFTRYYHGGECEKDPLDARA